MRQTSLGRVALLSFAGAIAASASAKADDIKMGYINKMGEHPWFVSEVAGAKAEAEKLGVRLSTQDVHFDANLALTTFDTMVGGERLTLRLEYALQHARVPRENRAVDRAP